MNLDRRAGHWHVAGTYDTFAVENVRGTGAAVPKLNYRNAR
jgi:muconolactone delta-isomerase